MTIHIDDDFDLKKIADSGQCFRWEARGEDDYRIVAGDDVLIMSGCGDVSGDESSVSNAGGDYEVSCSRDEFDSKWHAYFDLDEDYSAIRAKVDPERDPFLFEASEHEKGIRILRQDPWEALISFIISQNKNIPAIMSSIERLSKAAGERRVDPEGNEYYTFPRADGILSIGEEGLRACSLGYRTGYLLETARLMEAGELDLEAIASETDEKRTIEALTALYGVGPKVANCVSLFGLHHIDAFPVDVWVKRILENEYPNGYPYDEYSPYNGVFQQYMFAYYRKRSLGAK